MELMRGLKQDADGSPLMAHFILDTIRVVLEHKEKFTPELFHTMLSSIEASDVDRIVAELLLSIVEGLPGVSSTDLIQSFKDRGEGVVPRPLRDAMLIAGSKSKRLSKP